MGETKTSAGLIADKSAVGAYGRVEHRWTDSAAGFAEGRAWVDKALSLDWQAMAGVELRW